MPLSFNHLSYIFCEAALEFAMDIDTLAFQGLYSLSLMWLVIMDRSLR